MAVLTLMLSAQPTDKLLHVFQVYIVESQGTKQPGTELVFRFSGIFLGVFFFVSLPNVITITVWALLHSLNFLKIRK